MLSNKIRRQLKPSDHYSLIMIKFYFPELLFITEGKYWNQLEKIRKFRDVLSSGSHETGGTAKKLLHLIQPSQDPRYI